MIYCPKFFLNRACASAIAGNGAKTKQMKQMRKEFAIKKTQHV